ncbi:hypothetical protein HNQ60_000180 [Povalibacter uvarum]|uniref:GPI inositol-deacylase PGAP1-like alpha/beta domain-containing protein n=1 Tax=Povalibacter uvarum TaxID=732238 RepID=A0A841HFH7_9GAMM|nr:hypothetical protein [Povalibacter uvarum]MBB6091334.1 hypothetical protein [Povalibacter uvarum]
MPEKERAVVFVHGLAKKPAPDKLLELWLMGISRDNPRPDVFDAPNKGINLLSYGVPHVFNYYADVFYGEEYETDFTSYFEAEGNADAEIAADHLDDPAPITVPSPANPEEQRFLENFQAKLRETVTEKPPQAAATDPTPSAELELAGFLPAPIREAIIKKAAMEAYYFLFDKEYTRKDGAKFKVRSELRNRLLKVLHTAASKGEKIVLVTHSMGTMVAYDVLRNCADCPTIDTFITLGSPLGVKEVQAELRAPGSASVDFPVKANRWVNIYDPLDPICAADPKFANDYKAVNGKSVEDIEESNWSKWRHTITHYFAGTLFRKTLRESLGPALS